MSVENFRSVFEDNRSAFTISSLSGNFVTVHAINISVLVYIFNFNVAYLISLPL